MSDPLPIRRLIERITAGDIRIPAFQRDFVWEPDQVAFLLDSIYKKFPIGTIILWRTDTRMPTEKKLGRFTLPEPSKNYPVNYVLDGQQRITSLFSTFQTDLRPEGGSWTDIYFDMQAQEGHQDPAFVALEDGEVDPSRHFPARTLFDIGAFRRATKDLSDEQLVLIDDLQERFKEYHIPNEVFETDDRNKVAIVFERINRAGTELNVFELLSAWSWSEDFDLVEKFSDLQDAIAEHGFEDFCNDKDLQLRICAGIISGETTPDKILELKGEEIRRRFDEIQRGIIGALDFLKREVGVTHYKILPFPGLLVPLSTFFATELKDGFNYSAKQRAQLLKWFWRALFTRRFSSDVNQRQASDIIELRKLKGDENYEMKLPTPEVRFSFATSNFSVANANSGVLILMLNTLSPKSLLSGAKIDTSKVLKKGSKHEYHHIFPRSFLLKQGVPAADINVLANICFLTRSDNNKIKDRAPADYVAQIDSQFRDQYLKSALCPTGIDALSYEDFVSSRAMALTLHAHSLMEGDGGEGLSAIE
ncbi:DUF262 domain-containing protein [Achromobacter dolens]|uniref:DUF262 domain-containing protein n=1 Tax=Achromobacter dolens TaxID=1287738 RepID=UPI001582EEEE|nr:DUF262 domain-containing protein [Achromobacter dolens]